MTDMQDTLPKSWSSLSWRQLCRVWTVKQRYGGNADVARAAVLLSLLGIEGCTEDTVTETPSGEKPFLLCSADGRRFRVTPRELSAVARQALPWVDFPYGDPGRKEQKDDKGKVVIEARDPVSGYVSPMRDAMILPEQTVTVGGRHFALPQAACNNLTWQQYRSLQATAPMLFAEDNSEEDALRLQAQFLSAVLTPRSLALLDTSGGSIRFRPHYEYRYDASRAEGLARWLERRMRREDRRWRSAASRRRMPDAGVSLSTLFHVCFQTYQTALSYYAASYPLLFQDSGKGDPLRDALTGEVGTINTVMKYAGYAEQQQVYDSNLPFVLDILNTMTKEAREIDRMNSKIKRK